MFDTLRNKFEKHVDSLLWKMVERFPSRVRYIDRRDGEKYLMRFYLIGNRDSKGFCLFMHHFFAGDQDIDLHNHPWKVSGSFILTGGYLEERFDKNNNIKTKLFKSGYINIIRANDYHRIELTNLINRPTWTLFFSSPRFQDWGFKNRNTLEYVPHSEYISDKMSNHNT